MKVSGTISQLGVSGSIAQKGVTGTITQKGVISSIVESGITHTPPVFISAEIGNVDNNILVITYDIEIDPFSVPANEDYSITLSGGAVNITDVQILSDGEGRFYKVEITLSRLVEPGETGTFSYTGTAIRSQADNEGVAANLTNEEITNNVVVVGTVPVFVSAVVENATPTKVVLTYDQTLDESSVPATTDFTLPGKTISGVSIVGSTVEVTVSVAYEYGDVITIDYTAGANPIQGATGGPDADSLADAPVTNNIVDTSIIPYVNGFEWTDDDSDGYGNGWSKRPGGLGSGSIVTGNGFTGNAQRFTHVSGAISRLQYVTVLSTAIGATYRLRGKYRAGAGSWRIYLTGTTQPFTFDMGDNIGDAIEFDYSLTTTAIATIILTFYKASALADDYIEIDEIRLHKL